MNVGEWDLVDCHHKLEGVITVLGGMGLFSGVMGLLSGRIGMSSWGMGILSGGMGISSEVKGISSGKMGITSGGMGMSSEGMGMSSGSGSCFFFFCFFFFSLSPFFFQAGKNILYCPVKTILHYSIHFLGSLTKPMPIFLKSMITFVRTNNI